MISHPVTRCLILCDDVTRIAVEVANEAER
jgi:hypothetical protein